MSLLQEDDFSLDIALGQLVQVPCKFIQGESNAHPILVRNISQQLQDTGKNILPVIVQVLGEDSYQAILNTQILDAARQVEFDFIWCIIVDDKMQSQVKVESGEVLRVNILTASEEEIIGTLEYLQSHKPGFKTIKPKQVARAIVEYRKTKIPANLSFLMKQRCGIGKATKDKLCEFLVFA
jgi:hypothetical protein